MQLGSGFRKGMGAIPFHLFYSLPLLGLVLVRGQRSNVVNLLIVVGEGFDHIPLGAPILV